MLFNDMRQRFTRNGTVFKQTAGAAQFLRQGEIDVVGINLSGAVYAAEAAFHEAGLNYGNTAETDNRVLKKMLRTLLILRTYLPRSTPLHIYFLSPKVNPIVQEPLERTFSELQRAYAEVEWRLISNEDFTTRVVQATLERASAVADTSELFVRSAKLLQLTESTRRSKPIQEGPDTRADGLGVARGYGVQPLVRALMRTLLIDHPSILDESDKRDLTDPEYCKAAMGLRISSLALLRRVEHGRAVTGHDRYYAEPCGSFYVCSQWWKDHHSANAEALIHFVRDLVARNAANPGLPALKRHEQAFSDYLNRLAVERRALPFTARGAGRSNRS